MLHQGYLLKHYSNIYVPKRNKQNTPQQFSFQFIQWARNFCLAIFDFVHLCAVDI